MDSFKRKHPQTRRIILQAVVLIMLTGLTVMGISPLRTLLRDRIEAAKIQVLGQFEAFLGVKIRYESISPSIFQDIEVRGLELIDSAGMQVISLEKVKLEYDFAKAISDPVASIREIKLSSLDVDLDSRRNVDLLKKFSALITQGRSGSFDRIKVSGEDFSFIFSDASGRYSVENVAFTLGMKQGVLSASLTGSASAYFRGAPYGLSSLAAGFSLDGSMEADFKDAYCTLLIDGGTNLFDFTPQKLMLSLHGDSLEARKIEDSAPIDFSLAYDIPANKYSLEAKCSGLKPSDLVKPREGLQGIRKWLDLVYSGEAAVRGRLGSSSVSYDVRLSTMLPGDILPGGYEVELDAKGDLKGLEVRKAVFSADEGSFVFSGFVDYANPIPEGSLAVSYTYKNVLLNGNFHIQPSADSIELFSERIDIGGTAFKSFDLNLMPAKGSVDFKMSTFLERLPSESQIAANPEEEGFSGEAFGGASFSPYVSAEGSISYSGEPFLQSSIAFTYFPLDPLYDLAGKFVKMPGGAVESLARNLTVSAEVFVSTDFKKFAFNAPQFVFSYGGGEGNFGVFSASGTQDHVELSKISLLLAGYKLGGDISFDYADFARIAFVSSLNFQGIPYKFEGAILGGRQIVAKGDYELAVSASLDLPEILFQASGVGVPLPLPGFTPRISASVKGRYRSLKDWELSVESSSLTQLKSVLNSYPQVSFSGYIDPRGATIDSATLSDQFSTLKGSGYLNFDSRGEKMLASGVFGFTGEGAESYRMVFSLDGDDVSATVTIVETPIARFTKFPIVGNFSSDLSLSGSFQEPELRFSASVLNASLIKIPISVRLSGNIDKKRLDLDALTVRFGLQTLTDGRFGFSFEDGKTSFSSSYRGVYGSEPMTFTVNCAGAIDRNLLKGDERDVLGKILAGYLVKGSFRDFKYLTSETNVWPISASIKEGSIALSGGASEEFRASVKSDGGFFFQLLEPLPLQGTAEGRLEGNQLDADVKNLRIDMQIIWKLLGVRVFAFQKGIIEGSFKVKGNLTDPDFYGNGTARDLVCTLPDFLLDPIVAKDAKLVVSGKDIVVDTIPVTIGTGRGFAKPYLRFDRWIPAYVFVNCQIPPESPIKGIAAINVVDAQGLASCDLQVEITSQYQLVTGSITLSSSSISVDLSRRKPLDPNAARSENNLRVDLGLKTGSRAEFFWPNPSYPILRALLEPNSLVSVKYNGQNGEFSMKGTASIRGGEIFYFKRDFYLKEGEIVFNEDRTKFDPFLTVKGEMRERDANGDLLITIRVDNNRLSGFKPRLESSPAMSEVELLNLLGANLVEAGAGDVQGQGGLQGSEIKTLFRSTDILSQFYLVRSFEQSVRDALNLDLFSIRTQIIQNIAADITGVGETIGAEPPSLADYFDNTALFAGKYLGSDLFFQMMLQLQIDESDSLNPVSLDSELGLEFETPYFLLQWRFLPKHPENLYINDQSFGFSWRLPL